MWKVLAVACLELLTVMFLGILRTKMKNIRVVGFRNGIWIRGFTNTTRSTVTKTEFCELSVKFSPFLRLFIRVICTVNIIPVSQQTRRRFQYFICNNGLFVTLRAPFAATYVCSLQWLVVCHLSVCATVLCFWQPMNQNMLFAVRKKILTRIGQKVLLQCTCFEIFTLNSTEWINGWFFYQRHLN